jgi:PPK2 family polyphosphate:nucleotide phosphotransferase
MADKRAERIAELIKPLRVKPGSKVNLSKDFDPAYKAGVLKKKDGVELLQTGITMLADYQQRLAAQDKYGVLMCLQALDAGGKDGTIRHVMSGVNPQGVRVSNFKVPSSEELDHDYLWRYARRLPPRGDIAIFNRSHYEEVLVVRVHPENLRRQKLPEECKGKDVWDRRYREINDWERYLTDNGFKVVKMFLNLSKEEQRTRFLKRVDLPERNWKFSPADARERARWSDYQRAFSQMLSATSTPWAPWYVIPADRKWFARICAAAVLAHTLIDIDPQYPEVNKDRRQELLTIRDDLVAQAPEGAAPDPFEAKAQAKEAKRAKAKEAKEAKAGQKAEAGEKTAEADAAAETKELTEAATVPDQEAADARRARRVTRSSRTPSRTPSQTAAQGQTAAPGQTAAQGQTAARSRTPARSRATTSTRTPSSRTTSTSRTTTSSRATPPRPRTRRPVRGEGEAGGGQTS